MPMKLTFKHTTLDGNSIECEPCNLEDTGLTHKPPVGKLSITIAGETVDIPISGEVAKKLYEAQERRARQVRKAVEFGERYGCREKTLSQALECGRTIKEQQEAKIIAETFEKNNIMRQKIITEFDKDKVGWDDGTCKLCGYPVFEKPSTESNYDYMNCCTNYKCDNNIWHHCYDTEPPEYYEHGI